MDFNNLFPKKESKYLKAEDLQGREFTLTIERVLPSDDKAKKPVIMFKGAQKGLMCNITNAKRIAHFYGKDVNAWSGKQVILYMELVDFEGDLVESIRIKAPAGFRPTVPAENFDQTPAEVPFDDAIPF